MHTFDEWFKTTHDDAEREAEAPRADRRTIMLRAALDAEKLLGDPNWDRFLELLQGARLEIESLRATWTRRLHDPMLLDHAGLLQAKTALTDLDAQHRALSWVMELPKALIAGAVEFRKLSPTIPTTIQ